ncbi:MAG: anaerobic nitric oxide reductase flavorubredoxin [Thermodesulfobacteriota bacterium]|nr:anaerobic nitric oxide reductase flavorubredoxin [Thermodesulfobacteriota bacterium]
MCINLTEGITWVGKIDWELRRFHGEELSTHRGSSYNSYLIRDKKNVMIDTVWVPFAGEFVESLMQEIDLKSIHCVVANHSEIDHSGALPELMRYIPHAPIYCTKNGEKFLRAQFHQNWNFITVKTGDTLDLGTKKLIFIEAPMLHWPDSMFCYLTDNNILFSNDAFGQHYASELMYNDLVDQAELYQEAMKYYANILTPFSNLVKKKIEEVHALKVPVDMICPSHGIIWRENPLQIVEQYTTWADNYQENQITIVYDTMWNSTRRMAESIAQGISRSSENVRVKVYNMARSDKNDVMTQIFKSKALLVGSSTINRGILSSIASMLEELRGLGFKGKKAAAFGSYGWSGESVKMVTDGLRDAGFEVVNEGISVLWNPDETAIKECTVFGTEFLNAL